MKIVREHTEDWADEHQNVEDAVHIALVYSEKYRAEKAGQKSCEIQPTYNILVVYAATREIGHEIRRKQQTAHNERGRNRNLVELVKGEQAAKQHGERDDKRQRECDIAVYMAIEEAKACSAGDDVQIDGREIHSSPQAFSLQITFSVITRRDCKLQTQAKTAQDSRSNRLRSCRDSQHKPEHNHGKNRAKRVRGPVDEFLERSIVDERVVFVGFFEFVYVVWSFECL